MRRNIKEADFVLVICTATYQRRVEHKEDSGKGRGAGREALAIDQEISDSHSERRRFVPQRFEDSYRDTGRPSIDPELLLRILLIGHLYAISSERKLVEELRMHLAWR
jgi:hypothetical protein